MRLTLVALVLALGACSSDPVAVARPCITYLVTASGDTIQIEDMTVPPQNVHGIIDWWTEGDCP